MAPSNKASTDNLKQKTLLGFFNKPKNAPVTTPKSTEDKQDVFSSDTVKQQQQQQPTKTPDVKKKPPPPPSPAKSTLSSSTTLGHGRRPSGSSEVFDVDMDGEQNATESVETLPAKRVSLTSS